MVGGKDCPWSQDCLSTERGPCEYFTLTGADLNYWDRKFQAALTYAERAPNESAREFYLKPWEGWAEALDGLRTVLAELNLLEEAENLELRNPTQNYLANPLWNTSWRWTDLTGHDADTVLDIRDEPIQQQGAQHAKSRD